MQQNFCVLTLQLVTLSVLASILGASQSPLEEGVGTRARRVVGGTPVALSKYPFTAHITYYLMRKYKKTRRIYCTGVVIHTEFVLTAASCFETLVKENYNRGKVNREIILKKYEKTYVRAGTVDGERYKPLEHQERQVEKLYVHEDYLHLSTMFDVNIGLLRVKEPFDFTFFFVRPATLAKRSGPKGQFVNNYCIGMGYGYTNQREANISATPDPAEIDVPEAFYKTKLRQFKVRAGGSPFCGTLEKALSKRPVHFDNFYLCAISKNVRGFQHNCDGDTGGPLVCGGLVVGILSQVRERRPCDITGPSFSMYTEAGSTAVYDWIKTIVPNMTDKIWEIPFEDPANGTQWYPDEPDEY